MKTCRIVKRVSGIGLATCLLLTTSVYAEQVRPPMECFESRVEMTTVQQHEIKNWPSVNVMCSPTTGAVLHLDDPFDGTIPMGEMPTNVNADYLHEEAVVKPREPQIDRNKLLTICSMACHNGEYVPYPVDKNPRELKMHKDIVPDSLDLQHGRGSIWCLDCHHATNRKVLIDNFGNEVSFNQPQKLCGKCHGQIYRSWRQGIHGKRIGMWTRGGKKRWWVCTECHNPHDMQHGERNSSFAQLIPEPAPELPKGMLNVAHERHHDTPHSEERH
jgi:hypothetical protein